MTEPTATTMALILTGPTMSWGDRAKFTIRDTLTHPTRSGIIGLLACAQGLPRDAPLNWATDLVIHVRADNPGTAQTDFQMVGGGYIVGKGMVSANGEPRTTSQNEASGTMTYRRYLADAAFVVTVTSDDNNLIVRLGEALNAPHWPIYLGRKACVPGYPVLLGITTTDPLTVLRSIPAYNNPAKPLYHPSPTPSATIAPDGDGTGTLHAIVPTDDLGFFDDIEPSPLKKQRTHHRKAMDDLFDQIDFDDADSPTATPQVPSDAEGAPDTTNPNTVTALIYIDGVAKADTIAVIRDNPVSFNEYNRVYTRRNVGLTATTIPAAGRGANGWIALRDAVLALPNETTR